MSSIVRLEDLDISRREPSSQEALEALVRSRTLFLALDDLATHLHSLPGLDDLYLRAVLLGRECLDIDRMGILLIDPAKEWMTGTYGTDEGGRTTDERNFRVPFPERDRLLHTTLENRNFVVVRTDHTIYHMEKPVGMGWNAMYALWDGEVPLGFISCDNLLTDRPVQYFQLELFGMFASQIGSQILRKRYELGLKEQISSRAQMVGKVAHEINTPLGAIVSSNSSITELLRSQMLGEPPYFARLSPPSQELYLRFMKALDARSSRSSLDVRSTVKRWQDALTAAGRTEVILMAERLEAVGADPDWPDRDSLVLRPELPEVLEHVCRMADLLESSRIIAASAEKAGHFVRSLLEAKP